MYYLKKYESVNIDDFNSFLKKYQKSGYISTTSKNRLKDLGLSTEIFSKLEKRVKDIMVFIRDNDKDIFYDYFQEIKDIYPQISEYLHFRVNVSPISNTRHVSNLDDFNFIVSLDENNLPSLSGTKIDSDSNVLSFIVSKIEENRQKEIDKYKELSDSMLKKRPGAYDWWAIYKLDKLNADFIEKCKIYPAIGLKIFLHSEEHDYYPEDYNEYYKNLKESNKQIVDKIKDILGEILVSYLSSIGYAGVNFEIKTKGYSYYGFYDGGDIVDFEIKILL